MPKRTCEETTCSIRNYGRYARPRQGHAPNPTEIRVLSVGKSLKIEPFKIPEYPQEIGRAWGEWIEDFQDETSYFDITKIRERVNALKIYGGKEIKKLACNFPKTVPVVGDDDYKW